MAVVGPGNPLVVRICKSLGIEGARAITITAQINDVVTVDAWFMPSEAQLSGVADALEHKRYELHEVSDD